ncbi:LysR family transcriptional regulator [Amycolatopsis sp. QT-25]|nr:LysR family transcriptional regulator [Amycolatopsis sp. QT-25]WET81674.1 LysR family transcriptional regulator [Amycolatopsis sp. QT-25]
MVDEGGGGCSRLEHSGRRVDPGQRGQHRFPRRHRLPAGIRRQAVPGRRCLVRRFSLGEPSPTSYRPQANSSPIRAATPHRLAADPAGAQHQAFLALAEELPFGRTAERLGVSAARVSQTINRPERRFGVALFARTSRHVALTPIGNVMRRLGTSRYRRASPRLSLLDTALRIGLLQPAGRRDHHAAELGCRRVPLGLGSAPR